MATVLLVDDDRILSETLGIFLLRAGHDVEKARTLHKARELLCDSSFDVVLLDIHLPDGKGLTLIPDIKRAPSTPEVIIVTGEDDPQGPELAIKNGAWDYIQKPVTWENLELPLVRALEYRSHKTAKKPKVALKREGIIGSSPRIEASLDLVAQAADSDASVLITGETGTGKELFARAIHANSARAGENFVVVDCAALPETLVESVLFGHQKGSFTGADRNREGLVGMADGGTLFLDEIGELPLSLQKSFLRVLQERRYRPVGSKTERESDFRMVAATNRDLAEMAGNDTFRSDLLYRMQTMVLQLPALRDRKEDIKALTVAHMNRLCDRYRIPTKGFSEEFFHVLKELTWPGNVRELFNTLERILLQHRDQPVLYPKHLPDEIRIQVLRATVNTRSDVAGTLSASVDVPIVHDQSILPWKSFRRQVLDGAENRYIQELMLTCQGNVKEASRTSGLSVSRLYDLIRKYKMNTYLTR